MSESEMKVDRDLAIEVGLGGIAGVAIIVAASTVVMHYPIVGTLLIVLPMIMFLLHVRTANKLHDLRTHIQEVAKAVLPPPFGEGKDHK